MTKKIVRAAVWVALGSLAAATAAAAEQGFYVGAYYSKLNNGVKRDSYDQLTASIYDNFGFTPTSSNTTFDTKGNGYGFFGGYRWLTHLAFEGGYMDLGSVKHRDQSVGVFLDPTVGQAVTQTWNQNIDTKISGLTISALGILPVTYRMELYARGGVVFSSNEDSIFITNGIGSRSASGSKSSVNALAGVGASFAFLEIYNARLEYQRVFSAGSSDLGKSDIDVLSIGLTVTF